MYSSNPGDVMVPGLMELSGHSQHVIRNYTKSRARKGVGAQERTQFIVDVGEGVK